MTLALQHLATAHASGALGELAAAPTSRPRWLVIVAAVAAVVGVCALGGGARRNPRRRRRNPGECPHGELEPARCAICLRAAGQKWPPRHLGAKLAQSDARKVRLWKRHAAQVKMLERAIRVRPGRPKLHRQLKEGIERTFNAIRLEAANRLRIVAVAEANYDAERSYRPIRKNPKTWRNLGAQIKRSKERIARLTKRQAALWNTWRRLARVDDDPDARRVPDRQEERRWERQRRFSVAEEEAVQAIKRERAKLAKAIFDAEAVYDAERAHRPIKKNPPARARRAA